MRHGKPDPEGYLLAARKLGADPRRCLVVEDAEAGVAAGRAAGAVVAGLRGVHADIQITDLHQLTAAAGSGREPEGVGDRVRREAVAGRQRRAAGGAADAVVGGVEVKVGSAVRDQVGWVPGGGEQLG